MRIKFGPPKHGWMNVTVGDRKMSVSDVPCDSLFGLVKAMRNYLNGSMRKVVDWSLEPAYEQWVFERGSDLSMMHVIDPGGNRVISVTNAESLIQTIAEELEKRYEKSFKDNLEIDQHWSWDFPIDSLRSLLSQLEHLK